VRANVIELGGFIQRAYNNAPAVKRLFDQAGITPEEIKEPKDLARLPVTKKEKLLEMQRSNPPFGGFCGVPIEKLRHIFVSPGPIYDPQGDEDLGLGFKQVFQAVGVGPKDVVLNTWSYHLVPAGIAFDEALIELGATVIPAGVGNTDLQAQVIIELGVTVVVASTAFFVTLTEKLAEMGYKLPADWKVRAAFLGGEPGDWYSRRRQLEERFSFRSFSAYGSADLGMIGWECGYEPGYHVLPTRIVQICDPHSGQPLPDEEPGEIVVTALNEAYPLVRFGTGDVATLRSSCPCGESAPKLSPLVARVGDAVKAREIFLYPRNIEELVRSVPGLARAQVVVTRAGHRDEIRLRISPQSEANPESVASDASKAFATLCRLRPDTVEIVRDDGLESQPTIIDQRRL
jgi:phenylacetate-CoA ligase